MDILELNPGRNVSVYSMWESNSRSVNQEVRTPAIKDNLVGQEKEV